MFNGLSILRIEEIDGSFLLGSIHIGMSSDVLGVFLTYLP